VNTPMLDLAAAIETDLRPHLSCDALPEPRDAREFSTEKFIHRQLAQGGVADADGRRVLDALCKRVEVIRKVQVGYTYDISKAVEREAVKEPYAVALAALLLRNCVVAADQPLDYKFFNCVLKMLGGTLIPPATEFPAEFTGLTDTILIQIAGRLDAKRA